MEELIEKCPTANGDVLSNVVQLLAKMDKSKNKYQLIAMLADSSTDEYEV